MTNFAVTAELKAHLEGLASRIRKPKACILFRRGDKPFGIFLIEEGKVTLSLDGVNGNGPTRTLGPGCVIGVPGTLSGAAYSLTARTVDDCELHFVPREKLLEFLRHNPQFCFQMVEMLSKEISEMRAAAQRKREKISQLA